jgi:hypothetical protein
VNAVRYINKGSDNVATCVDAERPSCCRGRVVDGFELEIRPQEPVKSGWPHPRPPGGVPDRGGSSSTTLVVAAPANEATYVVCEENEDDGGNV